jgi:hypothetical protein
MEDPPSRRQLAKPIRAGRMAFNIACARTIPFTAKEENRTDHTGGGQDSLDYLLRHRGSSAVVMADFRVSVLDLKDRRDSTASSPPD